MSDKREEIEKAVTLAMSWHPSENGPSYAETRTAVVAMLSRALSQHGDATGADAERINRLRGWAMYLDGHPDAEKLNGLRADLRAFPTPKPDPVAAEREACAKCKHWQEKSVGLESAFLLASEDNRKLERLLTTAVQHIEHMAAWISEKQAGYVFEAIGEDLPDLLAAIRSRSAP